MRNLNSKSDTAQLLFDLANDILNNKLVLEQYITSFDSGFISNYPATTHQLNLRSVVQNCISDSEPTKEEEPRVLQINDLGSKED